MHWITEQKPSFSHVFTNWLPDEPENGALVERLRQLARRRGARFVPVWLTADAGELAERVVRPERRQRAKLMDPEVLRTLLPIRELPAPPDALVIDTTRIGPGEVADRILGSL